MNRYILVLAFSAFTYPVFSQQLPPAAKHTQDYYLQKSKNQQSGAWVLVGCGSALIAGGVLGANNATSFSGVGAGGIAAVLGGITMLTSVPLFLASGRNKRKAIPAAASIKMEKTALPLTTGFSRASFTALNLKIQL